MPGPFVFFAVVGFWIGLIAACFAPAVLRRGPVFVRVICGLLGAMLVGANWLPILAAPDYGIVGQLVGWDRAEALAPATMFLRTVPLYLDNLNNRATRPVRRITIAYPVEIAGQRYEPQFTTLCASKKVLLTDKGIVVMGPVESPMAVGGDEVVQAGHALIYVAQDRVCSIKSWLGPGPFPIDASARWDAPMITVLDLSKSPPRSYGSWWTGVKGDDRAVDEIVMMRPQIVSVDVADGAAVPASALWPVYHSGYYQWRKAPFQVIRTAPDCVQTVSQQWSQKDKAWGWHYPDMERAYIHDSPSQIKARALRCADWRKAVDALPKTIAEPVAAR